MSDKFAQEAVSNDPQWSPELIDEITVHGMKHQLHAARYAFHKVRAKGYGDAVLAGVMPIEQAREMYRLAMENYDQLIKDAANGHFTEADEADMAKGFEI